MKIALFMGYYFSKKLAFVSLGYANLKKSVRESKYLNSFEDNLYTTGMG